MRRVRSRQMAIKVPADELLTVREAARRRNVSRTAIYQAIREGRLTSVQVTGGGVVLSAREVDAYTPRARKRTVSSRDARPLWQKIVELGQEISLEEWAKVPTDASIN